MKRWRTAFFALLAFSILSAFGLNLADEKSDAAVRVLFVGMTNDPSLGPSAVLCVTNQASSLIVCAKLAPQVYASSQWVDVGKRSPSGLGYLQPGESHVFAVPAPAGNDSWRVPVLWQRQELQRWEGVVNRQLRRLVVLFGQPNMHRDAWLPLRRVVYSPEIAR